MQVKWQTERVSLNWSRYTLKAENEVHHETCYMALVHDDSTTGMVEDLHGDIIPFAACLYIDSSYKQQNTYLRKQAIFEVSIFRIGER